MAIKWGSVTKFVLTGMGIVGAPTCTLFIKNQAGQIDLRWFAGQIACVVLAAGVPAYSAWRSKRSELNARSAAHVEMSYALDPILRRFANHAAVDPASLRREITVMVVNAAADIFGPPLKTRSCYFEFVQDEPTSGSEPTKRLILEEHAGRPSPVRSEFLADDPRGAAAIALVEDNDHLFCEDIVKKPPPNWGDSGDHSYKTFISVGVRTRSTAYGMLTVDAPTPGDLSEQDVDMLRVMGGLIALAGAIALSAGPVGGQQ